MIITFASNETKQIGNGIRVKKITLEIQKCWTTEIENVE